MREVRKKSNRKGVLKASVMFFLRTKRTICTELDVLGGCWLSCYYYWDFASIENSQSLKPPSMEGACSPKEPAKHIYLQMFDYV